MFYIFLYIFYITQLCSALRRYAEITKVQFPVLMEKAVDLLIKGYSVSKDLLKKVYAFADYFYDCTDVFDQSVSLEFISAIKSNFIMFTVREREKGLKLGV